MIHIAILGLGTVGGGVAEVLCENTKSISKKIGDEINIKYILDIRDLSGHPLADRVVKDIDIILKDPEVSIVAELIGGIHPAYEFSRAALEAGKHVVTTNKELVASFGAQLLKAAREHNVRYLFEASVGGGIPIIRPINICLAANEIYEINGILNGTTNYILTQMIKNNETFDAALKSAQEKGYAERNPASDIDGIDTCRKICILAALAFGKAVNPSEVKTEGISAVTPEQVRDAAKYGGAVKLIGYAGLKEPSDPEAGIYMAVFPCIVPYDNQLANIEDVYNGILVRGNAVGDVMFYGKGAGNLPTASAVVADMIDILTGKSGDTAAISWTAAPKSYLADYREMAFSFYVRMPAESFAEGCQAILKALGSAEFLTKSDEMDGYLSFVTEKMSLKELEERLSGLGTPDAVLRIL